MVVGFIGLNFLNCFLLFTFLLYFTELFCIILFLHKNDRTTYGLISRSQRSQRKLCYREAFPYPLALLIPCQNAVIMNYMQVH